MIEVCKTQQTVKLWNSPSQDSHGFKRGLGSFVEEKATSHYSEYHLLETAGGGRSLVFRSCWFPTGFCLAAENRMLD